MKITSIKQQVKNPERASVFVDGKYSFSLTLDQLLAEKLKKDDGLDESRLKLLKKLSDEGKLRARALEWLFNRPHSEREFRDYLFRKKVEKDFVEALVEEFKSKGYLDDEQFARWFAENRLRKHKSRRAVTAELRAKGVTGTIIERVLRKLAAQHDEKDNVRALIEKLRNRPRYHDEQKLTQLLISRGYRYTDIKDALASDRDD